MKVCPRCLRALDDDARFCPIDGIQIIEQKDPYLGEVLMNQFRILEVCGRGSMGTVYRAWQANMDREVAIKILRKDLLRDTKVVKRFYREARASARLSHQGIITVHLVGQTEDGVPFMVMEYIRGKSLDEVCATEAPLPTIRAIHITRQITSALTEAHRQNIVHRDLKPENIILASTKQTPDFVKVLDFGIAKILYAENESLLTQTGAIFGTPYYLSPEQAAGAEIDHRCDIYALGVILFRMVTGQLPFQAASGMAVLIQHLQEEPPQPRELNRAIPQSIEQVVLHAMAKSPEQRFQTAAEMGEALDAIAAELYQEAPSMAGLAPAPPRDQPPLHQALSATISDEISGRNLRLPQDALEKMASIPTAPTPNEQGQALPVQHSVNKSRATVSQGGSPPPQVTMSDPRFRVPTDVELNIAQPRSVPPTPTRAPLGMTMKLISSVLGRRLVFLHVLLALGSILGGSALGAVIYWQQGSSVTASLSPSPSIPPSPSASPSPATPTPNLSRPLPPPIDPQAPGIAGSPSSADVKSPPPQRKKKPGFQKRKAATPSTRPSSRIRKPHMKPLARPAAKPSSAPSMTIPPAGPDPAVMGSDHETEPGSPNTKEKQPAPDPPPEPPEKNEEFYELLD